MSDAADVIIVGAGIIGCSIAHQLARRGARVRIFDARSVGAGATQASAGVLAPYIEAPRPGPLLDLAVRSLALFDEFIAGVRQDAGVGVEYRRCGTLEVALDGDEAARLQAAAGLLPDEASLAWIEPSDVPDVEPTLPTDTQGALLIRSHGYVGASQLAEALTWSALRHGADIETGRRIVGIRERASRLEVVSEDGMTWTADRVVVAAGSWLSQLGLDEPAAHAVRPIRGQLLRIEWDGVPPQRIIWGADCYVVPWANGSVLVGATVEDVGFDERTTAAGVRDLLDALCGLLPSAWRSTFREARVGLRPASSDGLPIIGPSERLPGVVFATGHYRNGILLAPITAAMVAEGVLDGAWGAASKPFHPTRFEGRIPRQA
jgi:glycine oxidase